MTSFFRILTTSTAILLDGTYDPVMHRVIERRISPGMVCMDVGTKLGEVALHMARRTGAAGAVYAFEPVPHVYQRLWRTSSETARQKSSVHSIWRSQIRFRNARFH